MKKTSYIASGILPIAIIVFSFIQCTDNKSTDKKKSATPAVVVEDFSASGRLPIAYIISDSLLAQYSFHKDIEEAMLTKVENLRLSISQKQEQLQKEVLDFQQKVKNNVFIDPARAEQVQQTLMRKRDDIAAFADREEQQLQKERNKYNQLLTDTVISALKEFNKTRKYQIIFNTMSNSTILLADDAYNITDEVAEFLNKRYVPAPIK